MNNRIKEAFDQVRADENIKDRTKAYLSQKIKKDTRPVKRSPYLYAAVCVCLLFLLVGVPLFYFTPTTIISIDINPSLELSVNRFDRIISVNGLNADGQKLAAAIDLKFKNYKSALEQILEDQNIIALLSGDEVLTITVTGSNETQSGRIYSEIETFTSGHHNTYCYHSSMAETADAHESGLSCGKYNAFLELKALDPYITPEAVQNMTMKEIRDLIYSLSGDGKNEAVPGNQSDDESGHHDFGGHKGNTNHRGRNRYDP